MTLCSSALLITKDEELAREFFATASLLGIDSRLKVLEEYEVGHEVVIVDSKLLKKVSVDEDAIVILRDGKVGKLIETYCRFIFNVADKREISCAFYVKESSEELEGVAQEKIDAEVTFGAVKIHFEKDYFEFKGKEVYITKREKEFLFDRLVLNVVDKNKRHLLFNIRKRLGKDFLEGLDGRKRKGIKRDS